MCIYESCDFQEGIVARVPERYGHLYTVQQLLGTAGGPRNWEKKLCRPRNWNFHKVAKPPPPRHCVRARASVSGSGLPLAGASRAGRGGGRRIHFCLEPSCISHGRPSSHLCRRRLRQDAGPHRSLSGSGGRAHPFGDARFVSKLYQMARRRRERSAPPSLEFRVAFKVTCVLNGPVREGSDI